MNWILVVDSDVITLRIAGQILCRQQLRVTGLNSAKALLDFLKDNQPDLILLGDVLWELGGFEAVSVLKQNMNGDIPVLLMAGNDNRELANRVKSATGVISKPLEPAVLLDTVKEILARQRSQENPSPANSSLEEIASSLEEYNDASNGMWMGKEVFVNVYRHMLR